MKSKTQILKQALVVLAITVGMLSMYSFVAHAAITAEGPSSVSDLTGGQTSLKALILTIVDYFLGFLGLLAVIMVIYGGVTYVSSAGNDEAVGKAKKIIMYALIGIVIIMLSFVAVNAILGAGTGTGG
ncbi:MAG: hypothetical protein NTZ25_01800 [Candidatus Peregrinibacteria bacterium]|nr:hypothetical protein [Candidatus Peregrinibacteria bacterium]